LIPLDAPIQHALELGHGFQRGNLARFPSRKGYDRCEGDPIRRSLAIRYWQSTPVARRNPDFTMLRVDEAGPTADSLARLASCVGTPDKDSDAVGVQVVRSSQPRAIRALFDEDDLQVRSKRGVR